jgi:type II secretory pathway pseudopilin PulG
MSSIYLHSLTRRQDISRVENRGFGLIELLVTISIMMLVSAVILAKQSAFNGATLLRSQAYEVALGVREVQMGVVSAQSDGLGTFRSVQGVYFNTNNSGTYRIFKDADNDSFYDANEEYGKQGFLDARFQIRAIRAVGASINGTGLAVVFVRPNFDAKFYDSSGQVNASSIQIDVARKNTSATTSDAVRTIEITAAGQISVK